MPPNASVRPDRRCGAKAVRQRQVGLSAGCIGSSTKDPTRCLQNYASCKNSILTAGRCASTWPIWRSGSRNSTIHTFVNRDGRLAAAWSRAPINWLSRRGSKAPACTGGETTSTRCWLCATSSAVAAGSRVGPASRRNSSPKLPSGGQCRIVNAWTCFSPKNARLAWQPNARNMPTYTPSRCLIPYPKRRHHPNLPNQRLIILGAVHLSDALAFAFPIIQKSEPHPTRQVVENHDSFSDYL